MFCGEVSSVIRGAKHCLQGTSLPHASGLSPSEPFPVLECKQDNAIFTFIKTFSDKSWKYNYTFDLRLYLDLYPPLQMCTSASLSHQLIEDGECFAEVETWKLLGFGGNKSFANLKLAAN